MYEIIDQIYLEVSLFFCNLNCSIYQIFCYRSIRSSKTPFPTNLKSLRKFRQFIQTKTNKKHLWTNWVEDTDGPSIQDILCSPSPHPHPHPHVDLLLRFPKSTKCFFEVSLRFWALSTLAVTQDHGNHFLFLNGFKAWVKDVSWANE